MNFVLIAQKGFVIFCQNNFALLGETADMMQVNEKRVVNPYESVIHNLIFELLQIP
jgi:hypothetical protein